MSEPRIVYAACPDATPETEAATLASVYKFLLDRNQAKKKGGPETAPDDARKESKHVSRNSSIYP